MIGRVNVRAPAALVVLGLCVLSTGGCFTATPHLNDVARSLEGDLEGASFEREFGLKLGRISTSLTRGIAGMAMDDEEDEAALATLKGIRKIEIATYQTRGDLSIGGPFALERSMERRGWQTVARLREDDGFTWIVYEEHKGSLRGLMVVSLEGDELTLVELRGKLDRTLAAAMKIARDEADYAAISPASRRPEDDPSGFVEGVPDEPIPPEPSRTAVGR